MWRRELRKELQKKCEHRKRIDWKIAKLLHGGNNKMNNERTKCKRNNQTVSRKINCSHVFSLLLLCVCVPMHCSAHTRRALKSFTWHGVKEAHVESLHSLCITVSPNARLLKQQFYHVIRNDSMRSTNEEQIHIGEKK